MCDQPPPEPIPPIPAEHPGLESVFRELIGLYHREIIKREIERGCRAAVRRENEVAAGAGK